MVRYESIIEVFRGEPDEEGNEPYAEPCEWQDFMFDAADCVEMLVDIAKLVNDPSREATFTVEKIRKMVNKKLQGSDEDYVLPSRW